MRLYDAAILNNMQEYVQLRVDEILYSKFEGIAALQRAATAPTQEPTQPYPSIEAVIAAHPKFVLLGNPGAGKSTLLQDIELKLLNKFEQESGLFPLWIDLGVEDNPENPHALIAAEWERLRLTDNVETRLGSGGLFLLLRRAQRNVW